MLELEKMQQPEYRETVFAHVFNTDEGKLVLEYLDATYRVNNPDFNCPNNVYWQLGRQSVITHIRNILHFGGK